MVDMMNQQMASRVPKEQVLKIKGDKTLSGMGTLTGIIDNAGGMITLLNPATKQYARMSMADYITAIQGSVAVPAAAQQMLASMSIDIQNKATGQVGMVAGIRAEEHLMTMSMSMNMPGAGGAATPMMRMEMHTWLASPDDLTRIPALREYADYAQRALNTFNATGQMEKIFAQMPGVGDKLRVATQEMPKNPGSLTVKTQQSVYSPMMAMLSGTKADPNAALVEMHMDLTDISTAGIDDAVFEVPADYQSVSSAEILKAMQPLAAIAPKAAVAPAPAQ